MQQPYDLSLPQVPPLALQAFTYNTELRPVLAPGQSANLQVQIDTDADFWLYKFMAGYSSLIIGGDNPETKYPFDLCKPQQLPILINIRDSGDQRDQNKNLIYLGSIAGDANLPYILPIPRRMRSSSVVTVTMTNVSSNITVNNIQFNLGGVKAYYPSDAYGSVGSQ